MTTKRKGHTPFLAKNIEGTKSDSSSVNLSQSPINIRELNQRRRRRQPERQKGNRSG